MNLSDVLVTVVPHERVSAYTAQPDKTLADEVPAEHLGVVLTLGEALATPTATAALFQHMPSPQDKPGKSAPRRGRAWAHNLWAEDGGLPLQLVALDLDAGDAAKTPWASKTPAQSDALLAALDVIMNATGAGYALSRTGLRVFVLPGQPITTSTYEAYVRALLLHLSASTGVPLAGPGVHLDAACTDLGRLFRVPYAAGVDLPDVGPHGLPLVMLDAVPCSWTVAEADLRAASSRLSRSFEGLASRVRLTGERPSEADIKPDWRKIRALSTLDEKRPGTSPSDGAYFTSWAELKDVLQRGIIGPPGDRNTRMMKTAAALAWATTHPQGPSDLWHLLAPCVVRSEDHPGKRNTLLDELWFFCHGAAAIRAERETARFEAEQAALAAEGLTLLPAEREPAYVFEDEEDDEPQAAAPAQAARQAPYARSRKLRSAEHVLVSVGGKYTFWQGDHLGYDGMFSGSPGPDVWREVERANSGIVELQELIQGRGNAPDRLKFKSTDALRREYATTAKKLAYSAYTRLGDYRDGVLRLPCWQLRQDIAPIRDARAEAWLLALCGDDANTFRHLQRWLARAVMLDRPLGALYLSGPKGCGKSLFGQGLARMWGPELKGAPPVAYAEAAGRFQSNRLTTPVLLADEAKLGAPGMTEAEKGDLFRTIVSSRDHDVEQKHVDAFRLEGYQRIVISANNDTGLQFNGDLTRQDILAIADRVSYISISDAAAERATQLMYALTDELGEGDYMAGVDVLQERVLPEYFLWCAENIAPLATRFGTWDSGQADRIVVKMGQTEPMMSTIAQVICNNADMRDMSNPEQAVFYHERHGAWYVRSRVLELQWDEVFGHNATNPSRKPRADRFMDGLRVICLGDDSKNVKVGPTVVKVYELDIERLVRFMVSSNHGGDMPAADIWAAMGGPALTVED